MDQREDFGQASPDGPGPTPCPGQDRRLPHPVVFLQRCCLRNRTGGSRAGWEVSRRARLSPLRRRKGLSRVARSLAPYGLPGQGAAGQRRVERESRPVLGGCGVRRDRGLSLMAGESAGRSLGASPRVGRVLAPVHGPVSGPVQAVALTVVGDPGSGAGLALIQGLDCLVGGARLSGWCRWWGGDRRCSRGACQRSCLTFRSPEAVMPASARR